MKHKLLFVLVNLAVLSAVGWRYCVGQQDHDRLPGQLHHYLEGDRLGQIPQDGFVSKEETALAIAKAVVTEQTWMKKYATGTWKAVKMADIWVVYNDPQGSKPSDYRFTVVEISVRTGTIVRLAQSVE